MTDAVALAQSVSFKFDTISTMQEKNSYENLNRTQTKPKPLHEHVHESITYYLHTVKGNNINNLYQFCLSQVEPPLIKAVLDYCNSNQTQAAQILGINRGTLRKKCQQYNINL